MTIKELYEWSVENKVENYDISILGNDGCYTENVEPEINEDYKEIRLQQGRMLCNDK